MSETRFFLRNAAIAFGVLIGGGGFLIGGYMYASYSASYLAPIVGPGLAVALSFGSWMALQLSVIYAGWRVALARVEAERVRAITAAGGQP